MCLALAFAADSGSKFLTFGIAPGDFPGFLGSYIGGRSYDLPDLSYGYSGCGGYTQVRRRCSPSDHLYHFSQFAGGYFGAAGTSISSPASGTEFWQFVCADFGKVFPLLLCPFLAAILLRALLPKYMPS